jgi:hypothetical protein
VPKRADAKKVIQDRIYFENDPILLRKLVGDCMDAGKGLVVAHYNTPQDSRMQLAARIASPRLLIWITPMTQRDFHKWLTACLKDPKTNIDCGLCHIKPGGFTCDESYSKGRKKWVDVSPVRRQAPGRVR